MNFYQFNCVKIDRSNSLEHDSTQPSDGKYDGHIKNYQQGMSR